jgi:hypothetical protein
MVERLTEAALTALKRSERRGDLDVMRTLLASIGDDIAYDGTVEEVREFSLLLMRMIASIDHEAVAGKGSLIDWADPENEKMLKDGMFKNRFPEGLTALYRPCA